MITSHSISTTIDHSIHNYASLIDKCIATKYLKLGKPIHSHLIKTALNLNIFLTNRLIDMYAKCNSLQSAQKVFDDLPYRNNHSWNTILSAYARFGSFEKAHQLLDEMPNRNFVSYNSMISGLTNHGCYREAIDVFKRMQKENDNGLLCIDKFTFVGVVTACASIGEVGLLSQVHGVVTVIGLELNLIMYNALIDAYGKCHDPDSSRLVFNQMTQRDVVSWTSLVVAYAWASRMEEACLVFDQMPLKNSISWTALIAGFAQNGHGEEALKLFERMQSEEISFSPTAFTFVSVLSACADLAQIEKGKQIHGYIVRNNNRKELFNVFVSNALIDMYSKCGDMKSATKLFEKMPEKDTITWNSIITGFAQNGYAKESLGFFEKMIDMGVTPNHVTFLGALSACSHMGLLSEGYQIFHLMKVNGVMPRSEHYAILIDVLGKKNRLEEAKDLIERAPKETSHIGMWGALLGACRIHGNLCIARIAAEALFQLEPRNSARYVTLSNIYAEVGQWEDAREVRNLMKQRGLRKEAGFSWIEVRNARYGFVSEDTSHDEVEEIYDMVTKLAEQMKEEGYVPYKISLLYPDKDDLTAFNELCGY